MSRKRCALALRFFLMAVKCVTKVRSCSGRSVGPKGRAAAAASAVVHSRLGRKIFVRLGSRLLLRQADYKELPSLLTATAAFFFLHLLSYSSFLP